MRFVITGTAGFIGNNLALKLLAEGHTVFGVDAVTDYYDVQLKRDRLALCEAYDAFTACEIRLEDYDALSKVFDDCTPDVVIHLAAQAGVRYSLDHPREYVDTNVIGSFNITELSKIHAVKHLIIASTSSAYGASEDYPFVETQPAPHPLTIYAATKLASELIAHSHSSLHQIPTTILRFFSVYGPWGRPDMAFYLFTDKIINGETIDVFNHGKLQRDFTYIDDLTAGIKALIPCIPEVGKPASERDSLSPVAPYRLVNIGNGEPVELMDYIDAIETSIGRPANKNMIDMQPGDVKQTYANSDLLFDLTGYRPSTDYREGIAKFVAWYKEYYAGR